MQSHTRVLIYHGDGLLDSILSSKTGRAQQLLSVMVLQMANLVENCDVTMGLVAQMVWRTTPL